MLLFLTLTYEQLKKSDKGTVSQDNCELSGF